MNDELSPQAFWLRHLAQAGRFNGWVFSQIAPYLEGDVLEIGCGTGTFTALISARAARVVALDLDKAFVEQAAAQLRNRPNVEVLRADVTRDPLPQGFDAIVMLDVLEHLPDDRAVLSRLRRALRAGGRMVIKVPAHAWLFSPMDEAIGHHRRYARARLRRVMEEAGMEDVRVWHFNRVAMLGWWFNGRVLGRTNPPKGQLRQFERMVPILRVLERWAPLPMGLSCIAVGRAPNR